ncbi:MAG TPA: hypothetical protein VGZ69_01755 [Candidatus Rhabdochlamydia sp.]|jgi:hypothetical protein|nr:hypothetical protein [Candidatus Rhabdochlamydia sp.]
MKVSSLQQSAVSSNNNQIERAHSTSIANIARNLNRVALPIIAIAAFASVLSVASFDYNSCIAECNATARTEARYDTCMKLLQEKLLLSISTSWELCNGPLSNMEMSLKGGQIHLKRIN